MTLGFIDELLEPDYIEGVDQRPLEEVRARREDLRRADDSIAYLRRLVQGRLDIVAAEMRRRSEGADAADIGDLVAKLPEILGERVHGPRNRGRFPGAVELPEDDVDQLMAVVDDAVDPRCLSALSDLDDAGLRDVADRLAELDRTVSDRRRALHDRIDALQAELVRRYKTGEANVDTLLR